MSDRRKVFEEKLDMQINELIEYYKSIEGLQLKRDTARANLHELRPAGDEAWENLKTNAETAWDELMSDFHAAAAKFE